MNEKARARFDGGQQMEKLYELVGRIGEGAYGVVNKRKSREGKGKIVAIKTMKNTREGIGIPQDAYREMTILNELKHDNIVKLERVFMSPQKCEVHLVYDYAEHDLAVTCFVIVALAICRFLSTGHHQIPPARTRKVSKSTDSSNQHYHGSGYFVPRLLRCLQFDN